MKTNFKKIAILAGTTAAMAAGSMSAHAVITAVPAPAQLVPLFYYNNNISTKVRITAPKSVGSDTVINLLGAPLPVATSWSTTSATSFTGTSTNAKIHYYVMSQTSKEVYDGTITVTPDDEYFLSSEAIGPTSPMVSGTPYYLILTNENANLGGTPNFSFTAEAWISNTSGAAAIPDAVSIPVLGLADTADSTSYPTPTNNVIEAFTSAQGGPVASPIISGIRLSSTTAGLVYRVVDVPFVGNNGAINNSDNVYNTLVAWNDRNGMTGRLYSLSSDEVLQSLGPFSLPNQLNIVKLGNYNGANGGTALSVLGITDFYTTQISNIGSVGTACTIPTGCVAGSGNGFLKLVIDANALPAASSSLAPGAYSSTFMFNIPTAVNVNGVETGALDVLDTGFFTSN